MMTSDPAVKRQVLRVINKMVVPGQPVTKKLWKEAYDLVRRDAIADTVIWKRMFITIEEPWNG